MQSTPWTDLSLHADARCFHPITLCVSPRALRRSNATIRRIRVLRILQLAIRHHIGRFRPRPATGAGSNSKIDVVAAALQAAGDAAVPIKASEKHPAPSSAFKRKLFMNVLPEILVDQARTNSG